MKICLNGNQLPCTKTIFIAWNCDKEVPNHCQKKYKYLAYWDGSTETEQMSNWVESNRVTCSVWLSATRSQFMPSLSQENNKDRNWRGKNRHICKLLYQLHITLRHLNLKSSRQYKTGPVRSASLFANIYASTAPSIRPIHHQVIQGN